MAESGLAIDWITAYLDWMEAGRAGDLAAAGGGAAMRGTTADFSEAYLAWLDLTPAALEAAHREAIRDTARRPDMGIAHTVQQYLEQSAVPYEVIAHRHTVSSLRTADQAAIEPSCLAKAVLLEEDLAHERFVMAVVPATHHVELAALARRAGRALHLASEEDAAGLFADCETGAIPPLGPAYGLETVWDDSLMEQPELYFEAGDHEHLLRVKAKDFLRLLPGCPHGQFSRAV